MVEIFFLLLFILNSSSVDSCLAFPFHRLAAYRFGCLGRPDYGNITRFNRKLETGTRSGERHGIAMQFKIKRPVLNSSAYGSNFKVLPSTRLKVSGSLPHGIKTMI